MKPALSLIFLIAICGLAPAAPEAPPRLLQKHDGASAWYATDAAKLAELRLRDEVLLTLRVEGPAPLEVQLLDKLAPGEAWDAEEKQAPAVRDSGEKGAATWQMAFLVAPKVPGEHLLELPPLRYRSGEGEWSEVKWTPVKIKVTTAVKKVDAESARDIAPIEQLPPLPPSAEWWPWAAGGAGVVALVVAVVLLRRRRLAARPPLTAEEWALRELERLAAEDVSGAEAVERWHREVSGVLRRFLERRYHLPAERRTTAEFLQVMRTTSTLGAELQGTLGEILSRCDLAKFARVVPGAEERREVAEQTRAFVQKAAAPQPDPAAKPAEES